MLEACLQSISFYGHVWLRRSPNTCSSVKQEFGGIGANSCSWITWQFNRIFQTPNITHPSVFFLLSIYDHNNLYLSDCLHVTPPHSSKFLTIRSVWAVKMVKIYCDNLFWEWIHVDQTVRMSVWWIHVPADWDHATLWWHDTKFVFACCIGLQGKHGRKWRILIAYSWGI